MRGAPRDRGGVRDLRDVCSTSADSSDGVVGAVARPLEVLFEDDEYLVVNKPAGVPVHGGAGVKVATVVDRILGVRPVHRLDADTSGALLLARSATAAAAAADAWSTARKAYWALVRGRPAALRLEAPLPDASGRVQAASTRATPMAASNEADCALLHVELGTGRTHQIRRHLADAGHPILMDDRYGDFSANKAFRRRVREAGASNPKHALLHARSLEWRGRAVVAPLPERWAPWLKAAGLPDPAELAGPTPERER